MQIVVSRVNKSAKKLVRPSSRATFISVMKRFSVA